MLSFMTDARAVGVRVAPAAAPLRRPSAAPAAFPCPSLRNQTRSLGQGMRSLHQPMPAPRSLAPHCPQSSKWPSLYTWWGWIGSATENCAIFKVSDHESFPKTIQQVYWTIVQYLIVMHTSHSLETVHGHTARTLGALWHEVQINRRNTSFMDALWDDVQINRRNTSFMIICIFMFVFILNGWNPNSYVPQRYLCALCILCIWESLFISVSTLWIGYNDT